MVFWRALFFLSLLVAATVRYAGEVTLWGGLSPDERYDVLVIDDFEERIPWSAPVDLPAGSFIRIVKNSPASGPSGEYPHALYRLDKEFAQKAAKMRSRNLSTSDENCQEVQLMINRPGLDALVLRPPEFRSVVHKGRPLAISLWVYGYGKRHVLYLLLQNEGFDEMALRVGELNFRGWRRLEIPLKSWMYKKKPFGPYRFSVTGVRLISHPKEKAGLYMLRMDFLQVLIDHGATYPGSQLEDEWP